MNSNYYSVMIGSWLLFMILAIINAGIRNGIYKPMVGDLTAHQISTIVFMILILFVSYFIFRISHIEMSDFEALFMGLIWLIFTIMFEFIAGHYIFGNSWDKLFMDYNILKGRIWSLVLVTIILAPYISNKFLSMR
jgi:hypothetical protein